MNLVDYQFAAEFSDPTTEQELLTCFAADPALRAQFLKRCRVEWFTSHGEDFERLCHGLALALPGNDTAGPRPALDVEQAIERLQDLSARRQIALLQQQLGSMLFDRAQPASLLIDLLDQQTRQLRAKQVSVGRSIIFPAHELAQSVVDDAAARLAERRKTGKPVCGISTGLKRLDQMINGWFPGLHVIAAGPGAGKTTLCLQFAAEAAVQGFPVLYASYENAARNLMLKLLCSRSGLNPSEVERGFADVDQLRQAKIDGGSWLQNLVFVEGNSRLKLEDLEQSMNVLRRQCPSASGLIVFDYLQRAAHTMGYEQLRHNVSLLTAELRELSMRLNCAVLAISSQNRAGGDYGRGGSGQLDSLKESGDLEYGADTVGLLLTPTDSFSTPPARDLELKLAKNRFGPIGSFRLVFRPDLGVFREKD